MRKNSAPFVTNERKVSRFIANPSTKNFYSVVNNIKDYAVEEKIDSFMFNALLEQATGIYLDNIINKQLKKTLNSHYFNNYFKLF